MPGATIARLKQTTIGAGFRLFRSTGAHRLAARWTGGVGAILMFHRVRPWTGDDFAPNRLLEITPEFLSETLDVLRELEFDIVTMDEAQTRIADEAADRRFAVLTFDDGYRDNAEFALPVLKRHGAPFTMYVVPGFAEATSGLWWIELEEAVRRARSLEVEIAGQEFYLTDSNAGQKSDSFNRLYWLLRSLPERDMRAVIRGLADRAGVDWRQITRDACLDWEGIAAMASEPLCTIGAHTLTHPMLARLQENEMIGEMGDSRKRIEEKLGAPIRHFAYPVGDPASAGQREFAAAQKLGFASAVTTRPGMLFGDHAAYRTALPRLSVNGNWQDRATLEVLLSGAPFALWNRGRKVNAA